MLVLGSLVKRGGRSRRVFGFDSFEGFPSPSPEDASLRNPKRGDVWRWATLPRLRTTLRDAGLTEPVLVKGFFEDTLKKYQGTIAFLHIDVDLYSSYVTVLSNLFAKVATGGIVAIDEYGTEAWPGATKAIDEFLAGTGCRLQRDDSTGKHYFIKV